MATVGETRIRTVLSLSADGDIDELKLKAAELINICEGLKSKDVRLASLAQTAFEEAVLWAVKASTA